MPLVKNIPLGSNGHLGIWHIVETLDFFNEILNLSFYEIQETEKIKAPLLKKQWWASRWLLHLMTGSSKRLIPEKDKFGKPFFPENDDYFSISHSGTFAAIIMSEVEVGVDIQQMDQKISRIVPRILSDEEIKLIEKDRDLKYDAFCWSAKEAVYKAYGKKNIDFRNQIRITSLSLEQEFFKGNIELILDNVQLNYDLTGFIHEEMMVVAAFQK